jgi:membrane-bound ClpP family serine protease
MADVLQIVGAILILIAFVAVQFKRLDATTWSYLLLNLVGSAVLAVVARIGRDWRFLLLEGVWAAVSAWGLIGKLRGWEVAPPAQP